MNKETISKDYANDMIYELEKAFWDERAQQDDINAGGRGERTALTDVLKSIVQTCRRLGISLGERVADMPLSLRMKPEPGT